LLDLRDARSRLTAWASIVPACIALAACTQIRVVQGGTTAVSYRLGVLQLQSDPDAPLLVAETTGFGVVPLADGTAVGWTRQLLITSKDPDRCQLIVVIRTAEEAAAIREQLQKGGGSLEHVCEINTHQGG